MQRSLFALAILGVLVLFGGGTAGAGVIFNMTGSCTSFCLSTGQSPGDPISGFVEFDTSFDGVANGTFLVPIDWHLEFGNVILDPDDESQVFVKSGNNTFQKLDANHIGPGSFKAWSTEHNIPLIFIGQCCGANPSTEKWVYGFSPGSNGPYEFAREDPIVAAAPEPGALAALAFGLAALGFVRRNRVG